MDYESLANVFRVLSNPVRIEILSLLTQKPLCVGELVHLTHHRQAYVSQQLMVLRTWGWVEYQKEGWNVCYRLADTQETRLMKYLFAEIWPEAEVQ